MNLGGRSGEKLGGVGGEIIITVSCMKRKLFSIKEKKEYFKYLSGTETTFQKFNKIYSNKFYIYILYPNSPDCFLNMLLIQNLARNLRFFFPWTVLT